MPAFPPLALLCADAWLRTIGKEGNVPRPLVWTLAGMAILLALAGLAGVLAPLRSTQDVASGFLVAWGFAVLAIIGTAVLLWHRTAGVHSRVWIPVAAVFAIELSVFLLALPAFDEAKSSRSIAVAAAEIAGPDGEIGLLGHRAMAGGLVYYGDRPVAQLSSPEDVGNFLASGGRAVVVRARHLDWLRTVVPVEVQARFREGRRSVLVVAPAAPEGSQGQAPASAQAPARPADP